MTRHFNRSVGIAFDLARLSFEAWMVMYLRMATLAGGGTPAILEAQRMLAEKTAATLEAQTAAGIALATGKSQRATARKAFAPYRRRVKANRRRLMRKP